MLNGAITRALTEEKYLTSTDRVADDFTVMSGRDVVGDLMPDSADVYGNLGIAPEGPEEAGRGGRLLPPGLE